MRNLLRIASLALLLGAGTSIASDPGTFTLRESFSLNSGDNPNVAPTVGADGMLYGVTPNNGLEYQGSLYRSGPGGHVAIVHWFDVSLGAPNGPLTLLPDGTLWGVAYFSGNHGEGAVYRFDPKTSTVQSMHTFHSKVDGSRPSGRLLLASDGYLYGTTSRGGGQGHTGTIYRIDPASGVLTLLHAFVRRPNAIGIAPLAGLVESPDGYLYGTTAKNFGDGTGGSIYRFDRATNEVLPVHRFDRDTDGGNTSFELVAAADGTLYGTTPTGGPHDGGVVFALRPGGPFTVLHAFTWIETGTNPSGGVTLRSDGRLYGVTSSGGPGRGGTAYRLARDGRGFTVLQNFHYGDALYARNPRGALVEYAGGLWGVTDDGGTTGTGSGTLYSLEPASD